MKLPTTPLFLLVLVLACFAPAVAGNKKAGLFQRLARALQGGDDVVFSDEIEDAVAGLAAAASAAAAADDKDVPKLLQDTWAIDEGLNLAKQAFKGDTVGVLRAMVMNYQDGLKEIWSQPQAAKMLLDNIPVFQGIKGMKAIQQKEGPLTSADGLAALASFTEYLTASAKVLEEIADPGKFAAKVFAYQNDQDSVLRTLLQRVEAGDVEATIDLQQELVTRELGDLIDMEAFGSRGNEPAAVSNLRNLVKETEPALYKLILQDDPIAQKYMADPGLAYKEAQQLSPRLAEAAKILARR